MAKFTVTKKGYDEKEVDEYINNLYLKYEEKLAEQKDRVIALKNEVDSLNEQLNGFLNKDEQISKALIFAVEKAEQIENNAKAVYNMELKRINDLYVRWEELLNEVEEKCPEVNKNKYINSLMDAFKSSILEVANKNLSINNKSIKDELKRNSDDFIKNILNRMDYVVNSKPISVVSVKAKPILNEKNNIIKINDDNKVLKPKINNILEKSETKQTELKVKEEKPKATLAFNSISERLKKLANNSKVSNSSETMAEKYLNSDDDIKINAYAKNFTKRKLEKKNSPFNYAEYPEPNESGFDLKEALNPKEDLDEIMRSFDFFDDK